MAHECKLPTSGLVHALSAWEQETGGPASPTEANAFTAGFNACAASKHGSLKIEPPNYVTVNHNKEHER